MVQSRGDFILEVIRINFHCHLERLSLSTKLRIYTSLVQSVV